MKMNLRIIGAASSIGQKKPGAEKGPNSIRDARLFDNIVTPKFECCDYGDIYPNAEELPSSTVASPITAIDIDGSCTGESSEVNLIASPTLGRFLRKIKQFCEFENSRLLALGGDHSVSAGTISGMMKHHPQLRVIWVDAHGDCNTFAASTSQNVHGMPLAVLMGWCDEELKNCPGWEWVAGQEKLSISNVAWIGVRDLDDFELGQLVKHDACFFTSEDVQQMGVEKVMKEVVERLGIKENTPVHLSFDIDSLDPAVAPCTGTAVPDGLTLEQGHAICDLLRPNLVSMDLVELNPEISQSNEDRKLTSNAAVMMIRSAGF